MIHTTQCLCRARSKNLLNAGWPTEFIAGYKSIQTRTLYVSLSEFRDFSLKQYTVSSPSQIVLGRGNFRRSLYLSTAPENVRAMISLQIHDDSFSKSFNRNQVRRMERECIDCYCYRLYAR